MKHKLFALLILISGSSLVACSDDKPAQAGPPSCLTNPTLPGCSLQKAALAQVPGSPEQMQAVLGKPYAGPGGPLNQAPGAQPPLDNFGRPIAGVSNQQIQARAQQVRAAIEADKQNPDSPFYEPPKEDPQPLPQRSPSSVRPSVVAEVQLAPPTLEGGGEAQR